MSISFLDSDIDEIVDRLEPLYDSFSGKTILITGGMGFLGRYFTSVFVKLNEKKLSEPCKITVADNMITAGKLGEDQSSEDGFTYLRHNVIEPLELEGDIDYILHCAGIASPYYYRAYPLETLEIAINGTKNTLELAKKHGAKHLFFSSSEIYGDPDPKYVPTPESYRGNVACIGPRACYDESKRVGETLCHIYHQLHGVKTRIVRPFNVYGPGMQEKDYRVLPNFASRVKAGQPLHVYGSGQQTRTFCYITDAIVGFLKVLVNAVHGEPYNIGNPKPEVSMVDLVKTIEKVLDKNLGSETVVYPDSYPADEPNRRCPDITKATNQVDYNPEVSLEDGLKRFFEWTDVHYTGE